MGSAPQLDMELNRRALLRAREIIDHPKRHRACVSSVGQATIVDLGIEAPGGLEAGRALAEVCMSNLGRVEMIPTSNQVSGVAVAVTTDHPLLACMASQYAGWQVSLGKYFAMGSGPMRAAAGKEALFSRLSYQESTDVAVGVLETRRLPTDDVVVYLAESCHIAPAGLTLLVAPTASLAGTVQIVSRSVETALHKLFELGFDLSRIESACGLAPLPPVAADDLAAIGRTNDAVLYGAETTLWVRGDDASLEQIGPQVPSSASRDHGQPFAEIFERYGRDFYKVDPHLFSPAVVTFINLDSGRTWRFGHTAEEVLRRSFYP